MWLDETLLYIFIVHILKFNVEICAFWYGADDSPMVPRNVTIYIVNQLQYWGLFFQVVKWTSVVWVRGSKILSKSIANSGHVFCNF